MRGSVSRVRIPEDLDQCQSDTKVIGLGSQLGPEQVVEIASTHKVYQIVQDSHPEIASELQSSEIMILHPDRFLENPLATILSPSDVSATSEEKLRSFDKSFKKGSEKRDVLEQLQEYLDSKKLAPSIMQDVVTAADELVSNAIFNAPHVGFDKNGPTVPRTPEFGDSEKIREARLYAGHDGVRMAIVCMDQYGALNPAYLLERLHKCFKDGVQETMNWNSGGGAGIGSYLIFQSALACYVGVKPGAKTVFCCTFPMVRAREKKKPGKNLHLMWDSQGK